MSELSKIKKYKPTTSTRRHTMFVNRKAVVTSNIPHKKLSKGQLKVTGRRSGGKVTVRHRGGGVKRLYREIDFMRRRKDVEATIKTIEYDPNRTAFIALAQFKDGDKMYIIAPDGLKVGDKVTASEDADPKPGNSMPLKNIPAGTMVYNVELVPGKGGQLARTAGAGISLQGVEGKYAQLKMPSGEIRLVAINCWATIGRVSNIVHSLEKVGKAGRKRRRGFRPVVRGMAMYGGAHPHGGGESRGVVGGPAKDIWGRRRGTKTRRKKKKTDKFILVRRTGHKVKK